VHKFWGWLGLNLGKHWIWVVTVGGLITIVLGYGITNLDFATGQDSYLNKSDQIYKDSTTYQGLFGGQAMLTLVTMNEGHTVAELFTTEYNEQWERTADDLRANDGVLNVVSPLTALQFNDNLVMSPTGNPADSVAGKILVDDTARDPSPEGQARRGEDSAETLVRLTAIPEDERTLDNPGYIEFLLHDNERHIRTALLANFPDDRHAQMITRLVGNASITDEGMASDLVTAEADKLEFAHAEIITTGAPVLLKNVNDYLTGGMMLLGGIAVGIMALILLLLFSVRWRLLALFIVIVGVVWAFGIVGYLGLSLTIVTIGGLPVMLGIGIDYAIQMHARVEEEVVVDRAAHPIQETARNLGPALLIVTFDAIFAFAALSFARVPMLRQFGLLLAIGVATICVNSILGTLAILGIREYRSPTKRKDFRAGPLGRLVVWLGSITPKAAVAFAVASLVIFTAGILVEDRIVIQTDPIEWVNQDSQVVKDLDVLDDQTGSSSELGVFVQADDDFSDETVAFVDRFTRDQLAEFPKTLLTASGIVEVTSDLSEVPGAAHLAPTGEQVQAVFDAAPRDVQLSTATPNATTPAMNIVFRTGPSGLDARAAVVRNIRDITKPPPGIRATPSGLAVLGVGLLDNLEASRIRLTYLAIGFVFVFLMIRLRSVIRAFLSMVPVLIAVGAASLFAYALGLELSPMTAVGGPLVVAACTEFTSLILLRFVEERRRGFAPQAASDTTASRTGRAFLVSALATIAGVGVIATSSLPLLRDFGFVVGLNVTIALLSALVVLPPMLVWAERRHWVTRGLVPKEILDRADRTLDTAGTG